MPTFIPDDSQLSIRSQPLCLSFLRDASPNLEPSSVLPAPAGPSHSIPYSCIIHSSEYMPGNELEVELVV